MTTVTLLTDFGWSDPWLAEVKAALLGQWARWPGPTAWPGIVDLAHDLAPGDIEAGAWFLQRVWLRFPPGTVHVAVVDPGVGTERPAVAARCRDRFLVGPGNGLLGWLAADPAAAAGGLQVVRLDNPLHHGPAPISRTFHGRDIFAPAAAHLAMGVPLDQVGTPGGVELLGATPAAPGPWRIRWIDRFGNAITDLPAGSPAGRRLAAGGRVTVAGQVVEGPVETYAAAAPGQVFWCWGSGGTLEIAGCGFSAAARLSLQRGLALEVGDT